MHITLIPKKEGITKLTEFLPMSLCNVQCKITSKILVNRIRPLLGIHILETQGAFICGRRATDQIIIATEMVHIMPQKQRKQKFCAFKIDCL